MAGAWEWTGIPRPYESRVKIFIFIKPWQGWQRLFAEEFDDGIERAGTLRFGAFNGIY